MQAAQWEKLVETKKYESNCGCEEEGQQKQCQMRALRFKQKKKRKG